MIRKRVQWKDEEGAVLVEFAIAIPFLLLIVWCMVDFARAYYTINSLATAVREGARYAAVQQNPTVSKPQIDSVVMQAFNAFGGPTVAGKIFLDDKSSAQGNVTVEVRNYVWSTTTPINFISILIPGGQITMSRKSTFRWEREP